MTDAMRALGAELRNWGRWGAEDQRGTTNLITPEKVVAAAGAIRTGKVFDLGIPLDADGPQTGRFRSNPRRFMSRTGQERELPGGGRGADDWVVMPLQSGTQWDALSHMFYDDHLYNGFPAAAHVTALGASRNAIQHQAKGIAGRSVLLDVARLKGVDRLTAGEAITPDDLDAACAEQGVTVGAGDVLLVRTGWWSVFAADGDRERFMDAEPGLSLECARWLHARDVAAVAADNWALEVLPAQQEGLTLPLHLVLLRDMGMTIGEMFDLDELAADCAADGEYAFFFTAPPLKFTGAVGSPLNPLAIK
ncbi:cyclase family protein [Streptomyces sp. NPDC047117]|uniref:cyclase family protein n=1 Tax=Streptomyces sp. NPDC047117 TaxID=3155379 RepID=UPI0034057E9D